MIRLILLLILLVNVAQATHLRGGYISIKRVSFSQTKFEIKIICFVNTGSPISFGGDGVLSFGDGESITVPELTSVPRPDLGKEIGYVEYATMHTYPGPGHYVISYLEPNRNAGIINMTNSVDTRFYVETYFKIDSQEPAAVYPTAPAVFSIALGSSPMSISFSSHDSTGYRLQYTLVTPEQGRDTPVANYFVPSGLSINPFNGLLTWDFTLNNNFLGEYAVAIRVEAYDQNDNLMGYSVFDSQILLVDGPTGSVSDNRNLDGKNRIHTLSQDSIKITFESSVPDWSVSLHSFLPKNTSLHTKDSTSDGKFFKVSWLRFNNAEEIERLQPYPVVVRSSREGLGTNAYDAVYLFFTQDWDFNNLIDFPQVITSLDPAKDIWQPYPNPFQSCIEVSPKLTERATFSLSRITGEVVTSGTWMGSQSICFESITSGIYILKIGNETFRLLKY